MAQLPAYLIWVAPMWGTFTFHLKITPTTTWAIKQAPLLMSLLCLISFQFIFHIVISIIFLKCKSDHVWTLKNGLQGSHMLLLHLCTIPLPKLLLHYSHAKCLVWYVYLNLLSTEHSLFSLLGTLLPDMCSLHCHSFTEVFDVISFVRFYLFIF